MSNPNIFVDWVTLRKYGIDGETLVTGTGEFRPASEVLDYVLDYVGDDLAWRIDDFGIVIISAREVIERMFPEEREAGDSEADPAESSQPDGGDGP